MKQTIKRVLALLGYEISRIREPNDRTSKLSQDFDEPFCEIIRSNPVLQEDTDFTSLFTTYKTVEYIARNNIPGDIIECGVYRGRHVLMMALTLKLLGIGDRRLFLYDTFAGMTKPSEFDAKVSRDMSAEANMTRWHNMQEDGYNKRCYCDVEEVKKHVYSSGYPVEQFHFVVGDVLRTVPNDLHVQIAILRLDTDWYELTKHELKHLYDLIHPEGVLIIDDYGSWAGCRKAVHEFYAERQLHPMLFRTHRRERVCFKSEIGRSSRAHAP